jgi:hypothetical protein
MKGIKITVQFDDIKRTLSIDNIYWLGAHGQRYRKDMAGVLLRYAMATQRDPALAAAMLNDARLAAIAERSRSGRVRRAA